MVSRLQAVLDRHALPIELTGTPTLCQYRAAGQILNLKLQRGQLMVRCGGGHDTVMAVLQKLRVPVDETFNITVEKDRGERGRIAKFQALGVLGAEGGPQP